MEFEITENDYLKKLDSAVYSDSVTGNVVRCTNSQCSKPAIPVCFDKDQFLCTGKERDTGRACMRLFTVNKLAVEYTCTSCGSTSDVEMKEHLDEKIYIECECGERCEPSESDEICELRAQGLI
ncbi:MULTISPECIES: hypothetical protein [Pseudoalteromonas]|uniref:hypothetical protein n=1 Tax=Pseudoalteromonas TaxID=53246 RepID=UPI0015820DDD|nr:MULTISPECIES: hypothetical protein [Pseudoalteromonas]MDI4653102.1 hypothetical protein [Pseudoalteromonas shioyasakiensis]NUJ39194.1 hypothetical protein [Pseudoalteromonas sp. 0303]